MRVIWLKTRTRWPAAFSRVSSLSKRIIWRPIGRLYKVPCAQRHKSGCTGQEVGVSDIPSALQKYAGAKSQRLASSTHAFTADHARKPVQS